MRSSARRRPAWSAETAGTLFASTRADWRQRRGHYDALRCGHSARGSRNWDPADTLGRDRRQAARATSSSPPSITTGLPCGRRVQSNPRRRGWQVTRDVVGELAEGARAQGLRFGLYYSGGPRLDIRRTLRSASLAGPRRGNPAHEELRGVRGCAVARADHPLFALDPLERRRQPARPRTCWPCFPTTTRRCPTAWSTTASASWRPWNPAATASGSHPRFEGSSRRAARGLRRGHPRSLPVKHADFHTVESDGTAPDTAGPWECVRAGHSRSTNGDDEHAASCRSSCGCSATSRRAAATSSSRVGTAAGRLAGPAAGRTAPRAR